MNSNLYILIIALDLVFQKGDLRVTDAVNNFKRLSWQSENCLSCKWFSPSDPINADILTNGRCVHHELQKFNLIISGRDWCNLFDEISQEQIDQMQEKAMEKEG